MADQDFALTHDELLVFGAPVPGEELNDHEITSLSTAYDYWPVMYKHGGNRNRVLSNNGGQLYNAPLRVSLIASSAAIHTSTGAAFNKSLPVPAGALNWTGAVIRLTAGGPIGTKASGPGTGGPTFYLGDGTLQHNLSAAVVTLTAGLSVASGHRWKASTIGTIRTPGAAGVSVTKGCGEDFFVAGVLGNVTGPTATIDSMGYTGAVAVSASIFWTWSLSDVANTVTLDTFLMEISYPGTAAS